MKIEISPPTKPHAHIVIGTTTCPICKKENIKVINDEGQKGNPAFHYLENHTPDGEKQLCNGSERMLSSFERT